MVRPAGFAVPMPGALKPPAGAIDLIQGLRPPSVLSGKSRRHREGVIPAVPAARLLRRQALPEQRDSQVADTGAELLADNGCLLYTSDAADEG